MSNNKPNPDFLADFVAKATTAGADAADAVMIQSASSSASWRMGRNEGIESAESSDVGLRVMVGQGQAVVSSTDLNASALRELIERAVTMARNAPEDEYAGLPSADVLAETVVDLDLADAEIHSSSIL